MRYRLGVGATAVEGGTIDPGGTVTVSFAAVPTDAAGGTTVIDAASLAYTGPASPTVRTATSNDVPITVADAVPTTGLLLAAGAVLSVTSRVRRRHP